MQRELLRYDTPNDYGDEQKYQQKNEAHGRIIHRFVPEWFQSFFAGGESANNNDDTDDPTSFCTHARLSFSQHEQR